MNIRGRKRQRWGERAKEKSWTPWRRKHIKPKMDLSVLDGVVSSVLSSSVVLCWLQCGWLQLDSGVWVIYWISWYAASECRRVCCSNVLFSCQQAWRATQPKTVQEGPGLVQMWPWSTGQYQCASAVVLRCLSLPSVWVDAVSSLVSVSVWCWQWGGCRCKLWPASMCHSLVSQNG